MLLSTSATPEFAMARLARTVRFFLLCAVLAGAVAGSAWFADRETATVTGSVRVIDGDSLMVSGTEVRLFGIDAPEYSQVCTRAGRPWRCGLDAKEALRAATADRSVICSPRDTDRYGRTVAVCRAGGLDLGAAMIKGGMAVAYGAYEADEREARDARRGIWASRFDAPATWRARHPYPHRETRIR
jgi:endonuclease YncB( thermonuclease family)